MRAGWLVGVALLAWLPPLFQLVRWRGPRPQPPRQDLAREVFLGAVFACILVLVGTSRQYDDLMVDDRMALLGWGIAHTRRAHLGWLAALAATSISNQKGIGGVLAKCQGSQTDA